MEKKKRKIIKWIIIDEKLETGNHGCMIIWVNYESILLSLLRDNWWTK